MSRHERDALLVSVPWPIRLFGDLHEQPGMATLAVAVDVRTAIAARQRGDNRVTLRVGGRPDSEVCDLGESDDIARRMPSLSAALRALQFAGRSIRRGFDFHLHSRVPGIENLLDSPALAAAWTVVLLSLHGGIAERSGNALAELVCQGLATGRVERGGGTEVYAAVLGGAVFTRFAEKPHPLPIEREVGGLILGSRKGPLLKPSAPGEALLDVARAFQELHDAGVRSAPDVSVLDEVVPCLGKLPEREAGRIYAFLVLRDLAFEANELLESEYGLDDDMLGEMLDRGHEMLRDHLGLCPPALEDLVRAAKEAGALGCKAVVGTDSFVAFGPGREDDIMGAVRKAGGDARPAPMSDGIRLEGPELRNAITFPDGDP